MALVIKDKPVTLARLRAALVYRLGAVPRVGDAGMELRDAKGEEINPSAAQIARIEHQVVAQGAVLDQVLAESNDLATKHTQVAELLQVMGATCQALAAACDRIDL